MHKKKKKTVASMARKRVEHKENSSGWQRAAKVPCKLFANPIVLSEKEIVISPYGKNEYLRKYDIEKDKFSPYIPYPTEIKINFHTIACDRAAGKIYLYDGTDKIFIEFDVHKQLVTKCKKKGKENIVGNGKFSSSLVHNGEFHVIGGSDKSRHLQWDTMKQKFIEHNMIEPSPAGHQSVLLKYGDSHNAQIVCFGGNDSIKLKKYLDCIYIADIHPEVQWRKLRNFKMPYKQYFFGCVLFQQSYILIFGGKQKHKNKDNSGLSDEIWILHLKNWKWTRGHLKCPKKAKYYAVLTDADVVHLFEYEGNGGHWKIPIGILINRSVTRIRNESLDCQVKTLTDKLMDINEQNEELLDAQKEYKHKIKQLKARNRELEKENKEMGKANANGNGKESNESKAKGGSHVPQARASLMQANDDYNALSEKYQTLQSQMKNQSNGGHSTVTATATDNSVLDIMADTPVNIPPNISANTATVAPPMQNNPFAADNDYDFWDYTNIVAWIKRIESGRYLKYVQLMESRLKQRNIDGHTFVNFQLNDLKNYGCNNYNDAVALLKQMKQLKESNDAFDTPKISNTDGPNTNAFANANANQSQSNNAFQTVNTTNPNINNAFAGQNNNNNTQDLFESLFN